MKQNIFRTAQNAGLKMAPPEITTCEQAELDRVLKQYNEKKFSFFFYLDLKSNKSHGNFFYYLKK